MQLEFEAEDFVHKILSRATLLKAAYEILFEAGSHEKLSEQVKRNAEKIEVCTKSYWIGAVGSLELP